MRTGGSCGPVQPGGEQADEDGEEVGCGGDVKFYSGADRQNPERTTLEEVMRRYNNGGRPENMPFVIVSYDSLKGSFSRLHAFLREKSEKSFTDLRTFEDTYLD